MNNLIFTWTSFSSWGTLDWIAQGFGLLAVISYVISYLQKDSQKTLYFQLSGSIFWCLNFLFLGAVAGLVLNIIGTLRVIVYLFRKKYAWARHYAWYIAFITLFVLGGILSMFLTEDPTLKWTAILPICAFILTTIQLSLTSTFKIRLFVLLSTPFWIAYDIIFQNIAGLLNDSISIVSAIVGIIVIDIIQKRKMMKQN